MVSRTPRAEEVRAGEWIAPGRWLALDWNEMRRLFRESPLGVVYRRHVSLNSTRKVFQYHLNTKGYMGENLVYEVTRLGSYLSGNLHAHSPLRQVRDQHSGHDIAAVQPLQAGKVVYMPKHRDNILVRASRGGVQTELGFSGEGCNVGLLDGVEATNGGFGEITHHDIDPRLQTLARAFLESRPLLAPNKMASGRPTRVSYLAGFSYPAGRAGDLIHTRKR